MNMLLIFRSNRGQTMGVCYMGSTQAFLDKTLAVLTLLCQQASISISSALLFRSVQAGTKENLKMIATQKEALEDARKSREDALKATKVCSNRYPFPLDLTVSRSRATSLHL